MFDVGRSKKCFNLPPTSIFFSPDRKTYASLPPEAVGLNKTNMRTEFEGVLKKLVLLQFRWRRGSARHKKDGLDSRDQGFKGLFSKDFISAFNILSISVMFFFSLPNSPFSIKLKSPANNICVSNSQTEP
jgi:hypothetical protein